MILKTFTHIRNVVQDRHDRKRQSILPDMMSKIYWKAIEIHGYPKLKTDHGIWNKIEVLVCIVENDNVSHVHTATFTYQGGDIFDPNSTCIPMFISPLGNLIPNIKLWAYLPFSPYKYS